MFKCPKCASTPELKTGRAWKVHMSRKHQGYSDREWLEASRQASAEIGETAAGGKFSEAAPPSSETAEGVGPTPSVLPLEERFRKLKKKFSRGLAVLSFAPFEHFLGLEPRTDEDTEALTEGWEAALDCLDIEPAFDTKKFQLRSWLWAFLFPVLTVILVIAERFDFRAFFEAAGDEAETEQDPGDHRAEGRGQDDARDGARG